MRKKHIQLQGFHITWWRVHQVLSLFNLYLCVPRLRSLRKIGSWCNFSLDENYSQCMFFVRNIIIDVALDQLPYNSTIVYMFQVEYPDGEKVQYPTLLYRQQETSVSYCNVLTGVDESAESMAALLKSMSLSAKPVGPDTLMVEVPPTR